NPLDRQQLQLAVGPGRLEETLALPVAQDEVDLFGSFLRRRFLQGSAWRRILLERADRQIVSIRTPRRPDLVTMAEQAFIPGRVCGNGLADVIAAPRRRV